jgi:hypothetical protein
MSIIEIIKAFFWPANVKRDVGAVLHAFLSSEREELTQRVKLDITQRFYSEADRRDKQGAIKQTR